MFFDCAMLIVRVRTAGIVVCKWWMCSTSPVSEYALYVLFDSSVLMEQKTAEIVVHTWCMYFDQHLINQEYTVCVCVCVCASCD